MSPLGLLIVSIVLHGVPHTTVGFNMISNWSGEAVLDPNLKASYFQIKVARLVQEPVVISHNRRHVKENIHHSVRGLKGITGSKLKLLQRAQAGRRGNTSSQGKTCGVCLRRKGSLSVSFSFTTGGTWQPGKKTGLKVPV